LRTRALFAYGHYGRAFSQHFKRDFAECGHCGRCGRAFSQQSKLDCAHLRTERTPLKAALSVCPGVLLPFILAAQSYYGHYGHPINKIIVGMKYIGGALYQIACTGKRPSVASVMSVAANLNPSTGVSMTVYISG